MQVLTMTDVCKISGGKVDWSEVGAGVSAVGLAALIASNPVGWVGAGAAAALAYGGGAAIGDGFNGGRLANEWF